MKITLHQLHAAGAIIVSSFVAATLLTACGGGGGNSGDPLYGDGSGTSGSATSAKVADLTLSLDSYAMQNSGSASIKATATAVDSNRNVLASVPVTFTVNNNATIATSSTTTDKTGVVTGTVTLGSDRSNRSVTVTAVAGSISRTATFQVSGSKIAAALSLSVTPGSKGNQVTYRVTDVNSNPIANTAINVSAPGLASVDGVTDGTGTYVYTYTAPSSAGSLTLTAVASGIQDIQVIQVVSADGSVPSAVYTVNSASLSANPNVVAVNTDSTANQSELKALFVATGNKPVANIRVRFDLNGDPNNIGGTFTSGTTLLYTNANGIVTSAYRPGTRSSPTDGVTVRACWDYSDFAEGVCPNQTLTTLTVTAEPLSVTIGTDGTVVVEPDSLTYVKKYVVQVVDSSGQAKGGVTITPKLDLPTYYKGQWVASTSGWASTSSDRVACTNEDLNRNGVLESGEDLNGSGKLEPRAADASISVQDSAITNSSGLAVLNLRYPQSVASWVDYKISVSANGISGTEGLATYVGTLPVVASVVSNTSADPAFRLSPYGQVLSCTDPN